MKTHRKWLAAGVIVMAGVLLNLAAYRQAWSMTHFVARGDRTASPEDLTWFNKIVVLCRGVQIPRPENSRTPVEMGLDFERHVFDSSDGNRLEGWYIPARDAETLCILFHAYSASKSTLLSEAQTLHALGHAVLLVDFRGSGGSTGNSTTIGYQEADDVAAAVRFANTIWNHDQVFLYGRSMGSAAILRAMAVHGVQPTGVIIECPFDRLTSTVGNRFETISLPAFPLAQLLVFWGGVQHGYNGAEHNPVDYAMRANCPVLLLHGARDPRVTVVQMQSVYAALPASKRLHVFAAAGHTPYFESSPDEWTDTVGTFIGQCAESQYPKSSNQ